MHVYGIQEVTRYGVYRNTFDLGRENGEIDEAPLQPHSDSQSGIYGTLAALNSRIEAFRVRNNHQPLPGAN